MNPPLLEVVLELPFDPIDVEPHQLNHTGDTTVLLTGDSLRLKSTKGISFPGLRSEWRTILDSCMELYGISSFTGISLTYLNEIPLQDLQDFRNYLNIGIDLPQSLNERFEFFRSEFTFRYPFGEIKLWLQPDWDDRMDAYCIQLNLESKYTGRLERNQLFSKLLELHDGLKDVFRQVLSEDYISQLPQ